MTATLNQPRIVGAGVHDIPEAEYHRDPVEGGSLSCSGAKKLLPPSCPALFDHERKHGQPYKKAFEFGSAAHKKVLGVGPNLVVIEGDGKSGPEVWNTDKVREKVAAARLRGEIPLKPSEMATVQAMAKKLREHPIASALLTPEGGNAEQTLVWPDEETGIMCRSLVDWMPNRTGKRLIIGDYKGLALDTPLPTPTGWTTMQAVQVGDTVFGSDGQPCTVTAKSGIRWVDCYRIKFDDATEIVCDADHRWPVAYGRGDQFGVLDTRTIAKTLRSPASGQRQHRIALPGPLALPEVKLPVEPYTLGCWLGDGTSADGQITKPDTELFDRITEASGLPCAPERLYKNRSCAARTVYGLRRQLRFAGILGNKHIPQIYLRASEQQRIALLQGLMDTDGSMPTQARTQVVFVSTDKALAESVRELALSLGERAIIDERMAHGYGLDITSYRVSWRPTRFNPFRLRRKADLVTTVGTPGRSRRRLVVSAEPTVMVPTQCIQVDSPDHTYLCGDQMTPTHNSAISANPDDFRQAAYKYGYVMQNAWYLDGIRALGLDDDPDFVFVVQMKTPPYLVSLVRLDQEALRIGTERNRKARRIFADCTESGYWPGFTDFEIAEVSLPSYATYQHNHDFES